MLKFLSSQLICSLRAVWLIIMKKSRNKIVFCLLPKDLFIIKCWQVEQINNWRKKVSLDILKSCTRMCCVINKYCAKSFFCVNVDVNNIHREVSVPGLKKAHILKLQQSHYFEIFVVKNWCKEEIKVGTTSFANQKKWSEKVGADAKRLLCCQTCALGRTQARTWVQRYPSAP